VISAASLGSGPRLLHGTPHFIDRC